MDPIQDFVNQEKNEGEDSPVGIVGTIVLFFLIQPIRALMIGLTIYLVSEAVSRLL